MVGFPFSVASLASFSLAAFTAVSLAPAVATAAPEGPAAASPAHRHHRTSRPHRLARVAKSHACAKPPVEVAAGDEVATFSLSACDGTAIPAAIEQLSTLARSGGPTRPDGTKGHGSEQGARHLDPRLLERLEVVVDHFRESASAVPHLVLVSGYRPRSTGSYHASGRALDFRIDGVESEALVAFCKTLPDTGCGYYPNAGFVHLDVRDRGAGHVAWIDASRPGEPPRYVSTWPEPGGADGTKEANGAKLPSLPAEEHAGAGGQQPSLDLRRFQ